MREGWEGEFVRDGWEGEFVRGRGAEGEFVREGKIFCLPIHNVTFLDYLSLELSFRANIDRIFAKFILKTEHKTSALDF